jgi:cobalt-zinc-cadmium efflux system protein
VLTLALAITASFMVVEACAGWWSGSLALLADAGHMLADTSALALALLAQQWARRPPDRRTTYGYRRAEVLAAFVNGIALAVAAVFVISEAVERWQRPREIHGLGMLATAVAGLAVNVSVAVILHRSERSNVNVRAALAHVLVDAIGSVGAIVAGLAVVLFGAARVDTVLSIAIAGLVAYSGWRILRETSQILLEGVPAHLDVATIEETIRGTDGVAGVHDLHVWRVSDGFDVLSVHVVLERGFHGPDVCRAVTRRVRKDHGISHVTVQPEAPLPDALVQIQAKGGRMPQRQTAPDRSSGSG